MTSPAQAKKVLPRKQTRATSANLLQAQLLKNADRDEALSFLAARPLHTVMLAGFIRDNGMESPLNRGQFYATRDRLGRINGLALIGHATLIETESSEALAAFARIARSCGNAHMLMGEQDKVQTFWTSYAEEGLTPRLICREMLYEQRWPVEVRDAVRGLRQATLDDLNLIMPVHAQMAFEESGVNPMETDAVGFRLRCARRIEQGRVFVWVEEGRLIFKADIVSDTPDGIYLEGVYVASEERGKGHGLRCISQLSRNLLARTKSVCLLVNENNWKAQAFYLSAGYKLRATYETIFLTQQNK
ncbi:MAG TPA: GNAT family N-acetyltransferase [Pyrinomonadaceae bacterium]|nr:GNAT family N-acetyltransferase [Pyrinomonadaceae bacterium]